MNYSLGLHPSIPSYKDYMYGAIVPLQTELPAKEMLESFLVHNVPNQGSLGTCVGQAAKRGKEQQEFLNYPKTPPEMSAAFAYTEAKKIDGLPGAGTNLKSMMQVLQTKGICQEKFFPYSSLTTDVAPFPLPSAEAYRDALNYRISTYAKVLTVSEIKQALHLRSYVLAGVIVFKSFTVPESGGFIPLPGQTVERDEYMGGHGIPIVGYDDNLTHTYADGTTFTGFLRAGNSWGKEWGDRGFCWIPYEAVTWRSDLLPMWLESWSSVDIIMPTAATKMLEIWIDKNEMREDGKTVYLDTPPTILPQYNRTFVPLAFIAQKLGAKVYWNEIERKVTIVL